MKISNFLNRVLKTRSVEANEYISENPKRSPVPLHQASKEYFRVKNESQGLILRFIKTLIEFDSVVDFGTGKGRWLVAAQKLGAKDVLGYDLPVEEPGELILDPEYFHPADLSKPVDPGRRFDLAVSMEVAEHINPSRINTFFDSLCGPSDLILFSAAIPYQGGLGHQSEDWMEYWAGHFCRRGFCAFDILRPRF